MILTPADLDALHALRKRAEQVVIQPNDVAAAEAQTIWLGAFKITFTVEAHPSGTYRRVTVSVGGNRLTDKDVARVLPELGFQHDIETLRTQKCVVRVTSIQPRGAPSRALHLFEQVETVFS